jgi:NitT/TauT family transport system ATP-binding protein
MAFECRSVGKVYKGAGGPVTALEDASFSVHDGEFVCIVGPSGCGKTTLLRIIAGLAQPSSGDIIHDGAEADGRLRNALVFQEHGLFPWMTTLDNVAFGLEMRGVGRAERRCRALEFVRRMGLAHFAGAYPHELSVGMRQRVGIARAFLADPVMLLMDEPLGSVDAQTRRVLQEELLRIWQEHRKLVVYVTHDIEEAVLLGDRVLVMSGRPGRILQDIEVPLGRPRDLEQASPQVDELKWHIWKMLEKEVRRGLALAD